MPTQACTTPRQRFTLRMASSMWMFTYLPEPLEEQRMSQTPGATTPYTKPQPVVIYGAVIAALTSLIGTLTALFAENATVVLILGIASAVVGALSVLKDQIVKGLVVPASDAVVYVNQDGEKVAGPASPLKEGTVVGNLPLEATSDSIVSEGLTAVVPDNAGVIRVAPEVTTIRFEPSGETRAPADSERIATDAELKGDY